MAQWSGQYNGNTHLSKVHDREAQLSDAVETYRKCETQSDRYARAQTVLRFADRLLIARLKAQRAQVAALDPRNTDQLEQAKRKLQHMRDTGLRGVLGEFAAADIDAD